MTLARTVIPAAVLLAVAGGFVLTANQASGTSVPPAPDPAARQETRALSADSGDLGRATTVLIDRCMRTHGFAYPVEKPGQRLERDRSYGLSVEEAGRTGYQSQSRILTLPDREPDIAPTDPVERKRFHIALSGADDQPPVEVDDPISPGSRMGTNSAGCNSSAQRELFGGDLTAAIRHAAVAGGFLEHALHAAASDPAMDELNKRWSACMTESGWTYADPGLAISAARGLAGSYASLAAGRPREIAVADATCQQRTGYPAVRSAIEEHHMRVLLDRNAEVLAAVRESTRAAKARAADVLGDA